jgi:hypothetical protein
MPNLLGISFGTNPMDILGEVIEVVHSFEQKFAKGKAIGHDDAVGLIEGALIAAPPPNSFAVAVFLRTWDVILMNEELIEAKNVYLGAFARIYPGFG